MLIVPIVVTKFRQISRLIICQKTKIACIVDPGGDFDKIQDIIDTNKVRLKYVLLTHGHIDHVGASFLVKNYYQVKIKGPHIDDKFYIDNLNKQSEMFDFPKAEGFETNYLKENDIIEFGEVKLQVLHTPGHTPGHICFYNQKTTDLFVGDVIFNKSIGNTSFYKGCQPTLLNSIKSKIFTLPKNTKIYPGHGLNTRVDYEIQNNPFFT